MDRRPASGVLSSRTACAAKSCSSFDGGADALAEAVEAVDDRRQLDRRSGQGERLVELGLVLGLDLISQFLERRQAAPDDPGQACGREQARDDQETAIRSRSCPRMLSSSSSGWATITSTGCAPGEEAGALGRRDEARAQRVGSLGPGREIAHGHCARPPAVSEFDVLELRHARLFREARERVPPERGGAREDDLVSQPALVEVAEVLSSGGRIRERERELRLVLERPESEASTRSVNCHQAAPRPPSATRAASSLIIGATSALAIARTKYASGIFFSLSTGAGTKSSAKRNAA